MADDLALAELYIGEVLGGRYAVVEFIGSGGFCLVFRAKDLQGASDVALKILRPGASGDAVIEFETEGELLDQLRSCSHVLDLLGAVANRDTITVTKPGLPTPLPLPVLYLVVALADISLADVVVARDGVAWVERLSLFRDVVLGLHQMHLRGIVHRDLKAENALVTLVSKNVSTAVVADLGRGRDTNQTARFLADQYLMGRGDLRFAPPELLHLLGCDEGGAFRRADLFLLGSALFELVTGQGITSIVYGDPRSVLTAALATDGAERERRYRTRLSEARALFESAFALAAGEFPTSIRAEGIRLLRQLCDPDPEARERRCRVERRNPTWGLQWVLRRIDILIKLEQVERSGGRLRHRKTA